MFQLVFYYWISTFNINTKCSQLFFHKCKSSFDCVDFVGISTCIVFHTEDVCLKKKSAIVKRAQQLNEQIIKYLW